MRIVLGKEIAQIDRMACEDYGISGLWLMENAGGAVADFAKRLFAELNLDKKGCISLLAGGGNNGGDALVVARLLAEAGFQTVTVLFSDPKKYKGDALSNWRRFQKLNLPFYPLYEKNSYEKNHETSSESADDLAEFKTILQSSVMIIDGVFGTGFHGSARGIAAVALDAANRCGCVKLAIDLPSGVNANDGSVMGIAFQADYTVTFGWEKYGAKVYPAKEYVGAVKIADIGLPKELLGKIESDITEVDGKTAKSWLPKRNPESHKGTYGHVAVVGGAYGMLGAPVLSACGAVKSGAGLVTVVSVADIMVPLACRMPEIMCRPLQAKNGFLGVDYAEEIAEFIADKVAVIGMGMGRNEDTLNLVRHLCRGKMRGLVLDADGLYALATASVNFQNNGLRAVLTPHPKEMAVLLNSTTAEVQADRLAAVRAASAKYGAVVVLKGAKTLVADGNKVYLNSTGNAGMATGGSGDVLSGIVGSLLAQGLPPVKAAALGVYVHGLAGDIAKEKVGEYGMTAGDLPQNLPYAFLNLSSPA